MNAVMSFVGLCILLGVGHVLRTRIRLLQKLYLPSCVIGGLVGLTVLQVFARTTLSMGEAAPGWLAGASAELAIWSGPWGKLPGFLINVVFACLFLGVALPNLRTVWRRGGPQLAYGQVVAWGQYVVGIGLFLLLIVPLFADLKLPAMFGAIIPVGFEGGHGTASGLEGTFAEHHWAAGKDFALASATAGIISAVVVGMILINWAVRKGHTVRKAAPGAAEDPTGILPIDRRPEAGKLTIRADAIESLTLHIVAVGLAVFIGYLLKQGMLALDAAIGNEGFHTAIKSFPLFPLCMIGGLIVQALEQRFDRHKLIDHGLTRRIQNSALDFLVVAAIATIRIEAIRHALVPFLILIAAGIVWNVFCVLVLARRMLPDAWFERSIAEMGQSMGVTATGLLLLRVVDPEYESPAADAFAYKQILHEPFMGGGLWTSAAIPLLALWGGWPVFFIALGAVAAWMFVALVLKPFR